MGHIQLFTPSSQMAGEPGPHGTHEKQGIPVGARQAHVCRCGWVPLTLALTLLAWDFGSLKLPPTHCPQTAGFGADHTQQPLSTCCPPWESQPGL